MSFLLDQTQTLDRIPSDIEGLREGTANFLENQIGFLEGGEPSAFFLEHVLGPIREQFKQNRSLALAQAKESAGNLTGSGFANVLGSTVNRSLADENSLIAQLLNAERARALSAILGFGTAGVAPPIVGNQPGFLSSLFQGVQQAAPFIASIATGNPAPAIAGTLSSNNPASAGNPFFF